MEYRNGDEIKYYGSDLNKLLNIECSKEMTVNNLDCIIYKRSYGRLRFIESKHEREGAKKTQIEILKILAWICKLVNKYTKIKADIFMVYANAPYEDEIRIIDMLTQKEYKLYRKDVFIAWLNFNADLEYL